MPRVLVIGGRGFLGAKVVAAFRGWPDTDVLVSSHEADSPELMLLDLNDVTTFTLMKNFDFVINCSNTFVAPPDKAIDYCLQNGITFLETTADSDTIERLLISYRGVNNAGDNRHRGMVILGLGIFPGLSNIVARELYSDMKSCDRLEVAIRFSPISGAGHGMCMLMQKSLAIPVVRYSHGKRVEEGPYGGGAVIKFGHTERATLMAAFPESIMLHWSTGVPGTATYFAPMPGLFHPVISIFSTVINGIGAIRGPLLWLFRQACVLLRARLLRNRMTPVYLTAVGKRRSGSEKYLSLKVTDGLRAGAYVISAAVAILFGKSKKLSGVYLPDEIFGLAELVGHIVKNVKGEVKIFIYRDGQWELAVSEGNV